MCLASIVMTDVMPTSIVDFAATQPERSRSRPSPDRLLEGQPEQTVANYFSDSTGQFFAGVWESTPGRWKVRYTENEFCHITRGRVRIEDANGAVREFGEGASFVIPAGFSGVWHVLEPTSKLYIVFEAATK
jgi:uncharacterized cupin superfamily protein